MPCPPAAHTTVRTAVAHDVPSLLADDAFNALLDREYLNPAYGRSQPRYTKLMMAFNWDDNLQKAIHNDVLSDVVGDSYGGSKLVAYKTGDIKGDLFSEVLVSEDLPMSERWRLSHPCGRCWRRRAPLHPHARPPHSARGVHSLPLRTHSPPPRTQPATAYATAYASCTVLPPPARCAHVRPAAGCCWWQSRLGLSSSSSRCTSSPAPFSSVRSPSSR